MLWDGTNRKEKTAMEKMVFPLPSAEAVKNMVFTIYAKGQLLSKATGSNFYASDGLLSLIHI